MGPEPQPKAQLDKQTNGQVSPDPPLATQDLRKTFSSGGRTVTALDGVSLSLAAGGSVTGLIGPDGAGKTTLMRLAAGLLVPDSGSVTCLGLDATRESLAVQAQIGYMPQRFGLYEDLSVQENLDLYADLQGLALAQRPARYARLMHMTGLNAFTDRLAGRLSGGMKQKLGLACTLVRPPRLLLLDEPTVGVDPVSRRELWAIVYQLVEQEDMTVLLSTAYLDEAERCADVILLHQGRVVDQGPPTAFSKPLVGRTFLVTGEPSQRRQLQARLSQQPGVRDAVLQGDAVRVVTESAKAPDCAGLGEGLGAQVTSAPVTPRFEDAFIDRLKTAHQVGASPEITANRPAANGDAIAVEGLSKRFGAFTAVDGLSFRVHTGEVFGLLGANGAGKTTTFRMLCGLLPVSEGHVSVAGVDLRRAPSAARGRIGYMSQRFSLYGNLTLSQNLRFFARAYGLRGQRLRARIDWALSAFELQDMATAESGALPLGYRQRLAMAAALLHEPDILFLDEPTSGVDPLARREFWARINALAEGGVTILVTTHFMEEAEYCDRLAIMAAGALLAVGSPAQIKASAASAEQVDRGSGKSADGSPTPTSSTTTSSAATSPTLSPTLEDAFIALIQQRQAA